jgi:hypothetical protein
VAVAFAFIGIRLSYRFHGAIDQFSTAKLDDPGKSLNRSIQPLHSYDNSDDLHKLYGI